MPSPTPSSRLIRFGVFEVDLAAGELRKSGVKIKLQDQPFRVLAALLARPGEVVTREELREKLWRDGTFVDFDRGVNTAINKIREALGDSASHPRFVETLPRRGYRFVGPVEGAGQRPTDGSPDSTGAAAKPAVLPTAPTGSRRGLYRGLATLVVVLILGTLYWMGPWKSEAEPSRTTLKTVPVTSYAGLERKPAISPDGDQVAFSWNGPNQDNFDIYVQLVGAGRPLPLTNDPAEDTNPVWSPDGRHIAFLRRSSQTTSAVMMVPALGGAERKLGEAFGNRLYPSLSWSPDGELLAIVDRTPQDQSVTRIFSLSVETGEKRQLTSGPAAINWQHSPAFSPDGRWLAFVRGLQTSNVYVLGLGSDGGSEGESRQLTSGRAGHLRGLAWSADGRSIVFSADRAGSRTLWRVSVSGDEPERVAAVGDNATGPSISRQGNRLVYEQAFADKNIWRTPGLKTKPGISADDPRAATRLIASTRDDFGGHFSPDGSKIVFYSTRSGSAEIWVSDADGLNPVQLTSFEGPGLGEMPCWSPDSRWIVFDFTPGEVGTIHLHVVSAGGGAPRQLTSGPYRDVRQSWSRDGRWIYFGSNRGGDWQVWKVPFKGGEPLQVTRGGGREAMESPDGAFLYYAKRPPIRGVWRVGVSGGDEEQIFDQGRQGHWEITGEGIYFLNRDAQSAPAIEFFRFSTKSVERLISFPQDTRFPGSRLISVSPDGRWVLFAREEHLQSDIMLVEDFH